MRMKEHEKRKWRESGIEREREREKRKSATRTDEIASLLSTRRQRRVKIKNAEVTRKAFI